MDLCKMEYIKLLASIDPQIQKIVHDVEDGTVKYIKVGLGIDETSGGALAKTVSRIKVEDNKQYLETLNES